MTIYALSSGPGTSGIAVIRVSSEATSKVIKLLTGKIMPKPRVATLRKINKIITSELIDEGIILWFPGPESYTGEDMKGTGNSAVLDRKIADKRIYPAIYITKSMNHLWMKNI